MNPLPPNADELVSAYLDNEAAPDEIAIVESEPELLSRVEELRALSGALGAPLSAPAEQKEAHLAAALGAFDELFGDSSSSAENAPLLAAAPDAAPPDSAASYNDAVVSLEAARERRRPRRFNSSVIAAVAAAVLLVVGLAALSFGRGGAGDDVATASDANVQAAEAMPGDEAASAEADSDAMTDSAESSGLSELDSSRSAAPPAAAFQVDEMADDEEAEAPMDDPSANDTADSDDGASGADGATDDADSFAAAPFAYDVSLGDFVDAESLREELEQLTTQDLRKRADTFEPGLFPGCQQEVPALAKTDSVTFVGQATVDDQLVEIHIVSTDDQGISLLVVDPFDDCSILSTIP